MAGHYDRVLLGLEYLAGYVICILVAIFGLVVVWGLLTGKVSIAGLLSESDSKASMSRFQLLIFVFVIALSFFLVVVSNIKILQGNSPSDTATDKRPVLPEVPDGVLALLGISASSYAVSKAIQHGAGTRDDNESPTPGGAPEKKQG